MQKNNHALNTFQNIELWCRSIISANTVTAKCAGMLGLLMEVEYAIEKYKSMAERLKRELPLDVNAHDFEEWTGKFEEYRSTYLLEDIKHYKKEYFVNRGDDDQDIVMEFSAPGFDGIAERMLRLPIPVTIVDDKLIQNIADGRNCNGWMSNYHSRKQLKEGIANIQSAREEVLKLEIGYLIEEKMKLLSNVIDSIIQQLTAPTKDAINGVYRHFDDVFIKDGGDKTCERQVAEWVSDHEDKINILELFDKKIASLRKEINETFYGEMWDEFFDTTDNDVQPIDMVIGRYIFRNLDKFNDNPDYFKQFFTHVNLWLHFNWKRMQAKEGILHPEPEVENGTSTEDTISINTIYTEKVRVKSVYDAYCKAMKETIIPKVLLEVKGQKRSEKWRWPHVYDALKDARLGYIGNDAGITDFGHAMKELNTTLKPDNVTQRLKDKSQHYPTTADKNIITDIINQLK